MSAGFATARTGVPGRGTRDNAGQWDLSVEVCGLSKLSGQLEAEHLIALNEDDRLALERAVGVLEPLAAQHLEDHHRAKEVPA
jgi:hypothetical protein